MRTQYFGNNLTPLISGMLSTRLSIFVEIFPVGAGIFVHFGDGGVSAVQGHPRSINLVPIESAYATSY